MKVLLVTQWFDPEPAFRGQSFAQGIADLGYDVEVVTGFPNYPGGKLYEGYKIRPIQTEVNGAINITRLPLYPSHNSNSIERVLNYLSFMTSVFFYLLFRRRRADLIYVYSPPMTVGLAVAVAQLIRRTPIVLEVQDMWPDSLAATGMVRNKWLLRSVGVACNWLYRRCATIVVQSPGFHKLLQERGMPEEKLVTILGWAEEDVLRNPTTNLPQEFGDRDGLRIVFAGTMGKAQALGNVLEAAKLVAQQRSDVTFYFIGGGIERDNLKEKANSQGIENAVFLPRVPLSEIGAYLSAADALLVHLRDDPLFAITIPSKCQAYLSVGIPILMCVKGDAANLVENANGGIVVAPENPAALAAAAIKLAGSTATARAEMGANGRYYYDSQLSKAHGMSAIANVLLDAVSKQPNK